MQVARVSGKQTATKWIMLYEVQPCMRQSGGKQAAGLQTQAEAENDPAVRSVPSLTPFPTCSLNTGAPRACSPAFSLP